MKDGERDIRAYVDAVCHCCSVVMVLSKLNYVNLVFASCVNYQFEYIGFFFNFKTNFNIFCATRLILS